jgi:formylmethanofuran dehydrogenase subunit E
MAKTTRKYKVKDTVVCCNRCNGEVKEEKHKDLKEEYPYFCPHCYENLYSFECHSVIKT